MQLGSKGRRASVPDALVEFLNNGVVPPVLVYFAFDKADGFEERKHPVQLMFDVSMIIDASKQLERSGDMYDRFRALYGLPVVPADARVCVPSTMTGKGKAKDTSWFRSLFFDAAAGGPSAGRDGASLFEMKHRVVRTEHSPSPGCFCFPSASNHPWIDRACVAKHETSSEDDRHRHDRHRQCLVLYQYKINDGMSKAVDSLNQAADAFRKEWPNVLCVAHVIGAGTNTPAASEFRHPYMLVRSEEVAEFYTAALAPAIEFSRDRHVLANTG